MSPMPFVGDKSSHYRLGFALAALGDLDGDGCHGIAVAANNNPYAQVGILQVVYGWGPLCNTPNTSGRYENSPIPIRI